MRVVLEQMSWNPRKILPNCQWRKMLLPFCLKSVSLTLTTQWKWMCAAEEWGWEEGWSEVFCLILTMKTHIYMYTQNVYTLPTTTYVLCFVYIWNIGDYSLLIFMCIYVNFHLYYYGHIHYRYTHEYGYLLYDTEKNFYE